MEKAIFNQLPKKTWIEKESANISAEKINKAAADNQESLETFFGNAAKKEDPQEAIAEAISFIQKDPDSLFMFDLMSIFVKNPEYSASKLLSLLGENYLNEWQFPHVVIILTDLLGTENVRNKLLNAIENGKRSAANTDIFEYAYSLITPSSDKTAITNLQKFYQENIHFEEYEVNKKMNEREISLLKSLIRTDEKILEMGCGTGRLFLEMQKANYDVTGFDFTPRHVEIVKQQNPQADVFQADWHDTKLPDKSQDVVYSLGRNILHDYSLVDQVQLFREAARILKRGGKFIFDIPNRDKGGYKEMVTGYAAEMQNRGIKNFRYGTIYDSPDGEHFATRYAYAHEDIVLLAQMTEFEILLVKKDQLETGEGDENLYYILEKK